MLIDVWLECPDHDTPGVIAPYDGPDSEVMSDEDNQWHAEKPCFDKYHRLLKRDGKHYVHSTRSVAEVLAIIPADAVYAEVLRRIAPLDIPTYQEGFEPNGKPVPTPAGTGLHPDGAA